MYTLVGSTHAGRQYTRETGDGVPTNGTGRSSIAHCAGLLGTGEGIPASSQDPEEERSPRLVVPLREEEKSHRLVVSFSHSWAQNVALMSLISEL